VLGLKACATTPGVSKTLMLLGYIIHNPLQAHPPPNQSWDFFFFFFSLFLKSESDTQWLYCCKTTYFEIHILKDNCFKVPKDWRVHPLFFPDRINMFILLLYVGTVASWPRIRKI
jgi:hypothetical protein